MPQAAAAVLVTRPQPAAEETAARLRREGFSVLVAPLMSYEDTGADIPPLSPYQALAFTSAQAVRAFAARTEERALPAFCVGAATARTAAAAGFHAVHCAEGDSGDVVRLLEAKKSALKIEKVLHVRGADAAEDLAAALHPFGIATGSAVVYKAVLEALEAEAAAALRNGRISAVTLFSARAAGRLAQALKEESLAGISARLDAICISPRVAAEIRGLPWKTLRIAPTPCLDGVVDMLKK